MKKIVALAMTLVFMVLLNVLSACLTAHAEGDVIQTILNEYPGYKFDQKTMHLGTRDYSFSGCIPELEENSCYMYVSVTNYDSAPTYLLIISVGEQLHDFNIVKIRTETTDYTFTTDNLNSIYSKTLNIYCSPNGKVPELIRDILASETVSVSLLTNGDYRDLDFTMNDAQRRLIELSYSYYMDAFNKADSTKLQTKEWILDAGITYVVTQQPHEKSVGARNGNGGLFPWCLAYVDERYPGARTDKDDFYAFLQIIIDQENLNMGTEALYAELKGAESKEAVYTRLDEIIAQSAAPSETGSVTDEIREYKKLLDEGIITQEEFDAKKKQLMGL